jgi:hypothetical protein
MTNLPNQSGAAPELMKPALTENGPAEITNTVASGAVATKELLKKCAEIAEWENQALAAASQKLKETK